MRNTPKSTDRFPRCEEQHTIQNGALFIADSHYPHHGDAFLTLLQKLHSGEIDAPQLFLMGDNFDLLFGHNDYIKSFSKEAIELLQALSQTIEIHYFEGNHDFCLKELFPDIRVYSREEQPARFKLEEKSVSISHGDKYATSVGYNLYCKLLRNRMTLTLLKPLQKMIIGHQMKKLSQKEICREFDDFERRVEEIMLHYNGVDLVIEGHFHQGRIIDNYVSLPSLACEQKVARVQVDNIVFESL